MPDNLNENPSDPPAPQDGTETQRVITLAERWATETTKIAIYFQDTKDLLQVLSTAQQAAETHVAELKTAVDALRQQCQQTMGERSSRLEKMMKLAKDQPLAFALVIVTGIMGIVILTLLGYKLNLQSLLGG